MRVLGIETSCDETGVAIYDTQAGLLAEALHSQVDLHIDYGGVVPELASRDHIRRTLPLIRQVMKEACCTRETITGIAYTAGPGLIGALMVGASIGRALAFAWGIPAIGIHHMEGHLLAPMLEDKPPPFPFVALLVSGGHTQLIQVDGIGQYDLLGESVDDAAGEAFDKAAKMLGMDYPGGPLIAQLAITGDPYRFDFPRPMTRQAGLDFSFSGLKTYTLTTIAQQASIEQKAGRQPNCEETGQKLDQQTRADIAACFQQAVIDTLIIKCRRALHQTGLSRLVIAGGVSANQCLRTQMEDMAIKEGIELYYARHRFCTDNGAMIAYAGSQRLQAGQTDGLSLVTRSRWPMDSLPPLI